MSRTVRHLPHGTRSPVHNGASVAQGPNCGLVAVPVLGSVSAVLVELPNSTLMRRFCFSGEAAMISLLPASVCAFSFCTA